MASLVPSTTSVWADSPACRWSGMRSMQPGGKQCCCCTLWPTRWGCAFRGTFTQSQSFVANTRIFFILQFHISASQHDTKLKQLLCPQVSSCPLWKPLLLGVSDRQVQGNTSRTINPTSCVIVQTLLQASNLLFLPVSSLSRSSLSTAQVA